MATIKGGLTKKGTRPNPSHMPKGKIVDGKFVPTHPGRGNPAKGWVFDPDKGCWIPQERVK